MSSIIKLEAISGVQSDGDPLCYLLQVCLTLMTFQTDTQVDQVFILLDCGWDERFEMGYIEALKRRIPQISAVLISYADIPHIGALPHLVGKCGLKCPIYATVPVYKMGQLFLKDWLIGHKNVEEFSHFEISDIDAAFDNVQPVKYNQLVNLKGDSGLQIMPLPAGHMIGGAIWRITKMGEEEIVYAVDFNHRKERHLNGCAFDSISRPNLFITDAFSANQQKRKTRDELLLSKLITTLREGGDSMIVIDTAGRVLELAHLLDQLWQSRESGLMAYNLVMLNNVASSVIEAAKSQVEWMSEKILQSCEQGKANPFQFRYLRCCHSLTELNAVRSPKVVLVSGIDMESGYSRELFLDWCTDSKNIVIVTGRSSERSLSSKLIRMAEAREQKRPVSNVVTLAVKRRIRLDGVELEAYRSRKRQEAEAEARLRLENVRRNMRIEQDDSSDDSDEESLPGLNRSRLLRNSDTGIKNELGYDLMTRFEQSQKMSYFKQTKKHFPMFPYIEERSKWDDYGQVIKPEDYTLAESNQQNKNQRPNQKRERNESQTIKDEVMEEDEKKDQENEYEDTYEEWPTKCLQQGLKILCKIEFIDFEGRADSESIKKIIGNMKPKQLILVHGGEQSTRALANYCREKNFQEKVFTPRLGEVIDVTVESHIYQVTLSDPLMSSLIFQNVRDVELSWVDARIRKKKIRSGIEYAEIENAAADFTDGEAMDAETNRENEKEKRTNGTSATNSDELAMDMDDGTEFTPKPVRMNTVDQAEELYLEVLPSNNIPPHEAVFVNDPKLTDLKMVLMKLGYTAEFSSGVLYINDTLSISRADGGKFYIEGPVCDEYYQIREALYSQFAIV
ncbi:Cleavage and polyadenylation specificity factor subunit 2 [Aphelenchoides besseyi]|nr:Cleavage and polyadenylation specificity factor subunit 2 [Aphelenchoides besseyi]